MIRSAVQGRFIRPFIRPLRNLASSAETSAVASSSTENGVVALSSIERRGPHDSVIVLDVGGKEFKTLRSTIASNEVLSDIVARAEANAELTQGGKAVFIDRDPTHFGLILQHLRNHVEGISFSSKLGAYLPKMNEATVRLPVDDKLLRDIYLEAQFYGVQELMSNACHQSVLAWFFRNVKKNSNPFDEVAKFIRRARRILVGLLGFAGMGQMGSMVDSLPSSVKTMLGPELLLLQDFSTKDGEKITDKEEKASADP